MNMFSPEAKFSEWHLAGFGNAPAFLFDSIESTHSLMKARASAGKIVPGTLIVADTQTAGRGRHERTWASPAGKNIYFNILIPLDGIPLASAPQITQVAAITFAEVFRDLQDGSNAQGLGNRDIGKITVKWPNDILCGKHKFCGILAELVYIKCTPAISMGVGINVNSDPADYAHLGRAVTTLKDICGRRPGARHRAVPSLRDIAMGCRLAQDGPVYRRARDCHREQPLHRPESRQRRRRHKENRPHHRHER